MQLILASASPARLTTLEHAGITPRVCVSDVDEDAVLAQAGPLAAADAVLTLARAKAEAVAARAECAGALVLGCDSMLDIDGQVVGKPGTAEVATARWRTMRGRSGVLHTGHWLIDTRGEGSVGGGLGEGGAGGEGSVGATVSTTVYFAQLTDAEIDAYVATGEPLRVAGGFTVDGLGGPYVTRIEGDYHAVVGLSLPLLRDLLASRGVPLHTLRP